MAKVKVGDEVRLYCDCGYGSLSGRFLHEQGVHLNAVPVVAIREDGYVVELPSGYRLTVKDRDMCA